MSRWPVIVTLIASAFLCPSAIRARDPLAVALAEPILESGEASAQHDAFVRAHSPRFMLPPDAATWRAQSSDIRRRVLEEVVFRGVPDVWRQGEPAVVWSDVIETGKGYRIRKLRFEALPGLWIPALLYEPIKGSGKTPAVLNVNGHAATGKSTDYKQLRCIQLAKRGMLALNLEWIGMGQLRGPGYSHNDLALLDLCGRSGLGVFYLAMSRGLDVLMDHPRTDPSRVAVTGLSGGGWQTITLSSLDERVKLAVPVAGYSALEQRIDHRNSIGDLEQCPTDLIATADYVHLSALMTPRPTLLVYNAKDDCCFVAATVKSNTFDPVVPLYEQAGAESAWQYYENTEPGTHNYERDNRQQLYRFINEHFFPGEKRDFDEIPSHDEVLSAETLNVALPADNATFHSLAAEAAVGLPKPCNDSVQERRRRLGEILRFRTLRVSEEQLGDPQQVDGLKLVRHRLDVGDYWTIPIVVVEGTDPRKTAMLIADSGFFSQSPRIRLLAAGGTRVVAVDPTLIGQARPAGRLAQNAMLMSTVGQRPLGVQVSQLSAATAWAARKYRTEPIELMSVGPRTGLMALCTAALDAVGTIGEIRAEEATEDLNAFLLPSAGYNKTPEIYCFGLYEWFDGPRLRNLARSQ